MSKRPFLLYHWSPTDRRKSILHDGLCPGKRGNINGNELVDENYRADCVCFTQSPSSSWALSPAIVGQRTKNACSWDLWMVWSTSADFKKEPKVNDGWQMREYRSMERIPKSKIWLVGTREFVPVKRKKA